MTDQIVLTIPEDISDRARQIAETTEQPVEQVLIEHLKTLSVPLPALPPEEQAELDALHHLSDDALWTIARVSGDDERARQVYEECLMVCQQTGEVRRTCYMGFGLSHIAQHEGDHERAMDFGRQGLRLARERKDANEMANGMAVLAGSFSPTGQPQRAARLPGASEAVAERIGAFHHPSDRPELDRITAEVRAQLNEAAFRAAWEKGRKMTLEQAVVYALGEQM